MKKFEPAQLAKIAFKLRQDVLSMVYQAQSGHLAGALGMADLITTLYFGGILRHDPKRANWDKRDYFLLSNGHTCSILYAALAKAGYFPKEELETFRQINSRLQGHPHFLMTNKGTTDNKTLPGVENTAGPLGQGASQAAGLAYALKMDAKNNQVFCLLSDGEQQEGQTWEAYMFAAHYQLDNLIYLIDLNHIQISGQTKDVLSLGDLKLKLIAFGLHVLEADGHNFEDLLLKLKTAKKDKRQAVAVLLKNTPGKGVVFMENDHRWHGGAPNKKEFERAMKQLRMVKNG